MAHVSEVAMERVEPSLVAVVRGTARQRDLPAVIPAACGEVWQFARSANLSGLGRHVAIYHDATIRYECGVEVSSRFEGNDRVHCSSTPGGWAAHATLRGPYSELGLAHRAILDWCSRTGHTQAGPSWEVYGHGTDRVEDIVTDVYYLLADARLAQQLDSDRSTLD